MWANRRPNASFVRQKDRKYVGPKMDPTVSDNACAHTQYIWIPTHYKQTKTLSENTKQWYKFIKYCNIPRVCAWGNKTWGVILHDVLQFGGMVAIQHLHPVSSKMMWSTQANLWCRKCRKHHWTADLNKITFINTGKDYSSLTKRLINICTWEIFTPPYINQTKFKCILLMSHY